MRLFQAIFFIAGIAAVAHAEATAPAEKQVEAFVESCFKAAANKRWLDYANCFDRAGLKEFQRLSIGVMSRDKSVSREFVTYYNKEVTLPQLRAAEPTEFFAASLGGTVMSVIARSGLEAGPTSFDILSVSKNADGKYFVVVNSVARMIKDGKTLESRKTEVTTVILHEGSYQLRCQHRCSTSLGFGNDCQQPARADAGYNASCFLILSWPAPHIRTVSHMNLNALGITVTSQRDAGSQIEYSFSFPQGSETVLLQCVLEAMENGYELSVPDPTNGDCSREVKRVAGGFEIKRGCHGASGTWRTAKISEAHAWLLSGILASSQVCRPGYGAVLIAHK